MNFNTSIKRFIPSILLNFLKSSINSSNKQITRKIQEPIVDNEESMLRKIGRYQNSVVSFLGRKIEIVDNASYFFIKNEIFKLQIYKFNCSAEKPYIIDCGANIGLSIIYFKQLFPQAEIIGFEPDYNVFKALQHNIEAFGFANVTLVKKACWNTETILEFFSEGADAGRAAKDFDNHNIIKVKTVSLRSFLDKKVDFLKIDIEGAENEVLHDIQDLLGNVDKIFVEFHSFVGKEQMLPEVLTILKNAGFRFIIHHIGVHSSNPFISVVEYNNMDLQINIFGYRI
jgi:FkbM family methyltransferase